MAHIVLITTERSVLRVRSVSIRRVLHARGFPMCREILSVSAEERDLGFSSSIGLATVMLKPSCVLHPVLYQ